MTYCYPGIGGKPIILVCVECLLTKSAWHFPMLVDTGADSTCFPGSLAKAFGHDNAHPDVAVLKDEVWGIGGSSDVYLHSLRIGLIHPSKSSRQKTVLAWKSGLDKVHFIEKMDCPHGLIGMDIISQWKELSLQPQGKPGAAGVLIKITV